MFFRQKKRPSFPDPFFHSHRAMASAPLSSPSPSVFRSSTPTGWSHEKMPAEVPIELAEARPTVASAEGGSQSLESWFYFCQANHEKKMASSKVKGSMSLRAGAQRREHRLLEPTYWAPSPGATAAACGTDEHSAALHNVI